MDDHHGLGVNVTGELRLALDVSHIAIPERNNAFWEYFMKKREGGSGPKPDDLFLIHCNINQVRELFETWDDQQALAWLVQLEEECC